MNHLSTRRQIEGALPTAAALVRLKSEVHALWILTLADISVSSGQPEAVKSLGLSPVKGFFLVTLPQAVAGCIRR